MSGERITRQELIKSARMASRNAKTEAEAKNIPYAVQTGRNIVKHYPGGSTKTIATLPKAYVTLAQKSYRIA